VVRAWGDQRIDEPRPSEIEQLRAQVQANVADGYLDAADNPALKVDKPRRLPSSGSRNCRPPRRC
jgi:hypothetical protein